MNILNFFKDKCMIADDNASTITNLMQGLSPIATLQQVNAEKLIKVKEQMGERYILHPVHNIKRKVSI